MTTDTAPAGWYPDSARPGNERYWDGQQWTEQMRSQATVTPSLPDSSGDGRKAARAEARAAKDAANEQAKAEKEAARKDAAYRASPVGQAVAAREQDQGFFEIQLVVGSSQRDSTIFGGNNTNVSKVKQTTHAGTLAAIEAVGWRLEHVGYIFQVTSESSRDKFMASGQQVAVSGQTIGIYLFRAADRIASE